MMETRIQNNNIDGKKGNNRYYRRKICVFCTNGWTPDYKNAALLRRSMSERGKIVGHVRSGVCARHQRSLTLAIKRARYLGLLPYVARVA